GKLTDKEKVREGVDLAIEHMSVTYAGSLAGLDRNDRMRTFSETLEAVTDGDVRTSLRETKTGDVKLRSFKVVGRSNPFAQRSRTPRAPGPSLWPVWLGRVGCGPSARRSRQLPRAM